MQPFFLTGRRGRLFALHHPAAPPATAGAPPGQVLYLPPFAEEMNRSRRMAALMARAAAAAGLGFLILDPYGCGDSDGNFEEADWETWRADALAAIAWCAGQPGGDRLTILGLRLGALLALDAVRAAAQPIGRVVLWQPPASGEALITQFLRIRMAAALGAGGGETTRALRDRLVAGEIVEVAGYGLAPTLAAAIDALRLGPLGADCPAPIRAVEISPAADAAPSPAVQAACDTWRAAGRDARATVAPGEAFWTMQEITVAPALIAATLPILAVDD